MTLPKPQHMQSNAPPESFNRVPSVLVNGVGISIGGGIVRILFVDQAAKPGGEPGKPAEVDAQPRASVAMSVPEAENLIEGLRNTIDAHNAQATRPEGKAN